MSMSMTAVARMQLGSIRRDNRAVIFVEFALSLPILMVLAFTSLEVANVAISTMRVGQIAMTVADNLSRARQSVPLTLPQLREVDINDSLLGAQIQAGTMPLLENGRIVVSSLQRNSAGKQVIQWQRCKGKKTNAQSKYGNENATEGTTPGFKGMGEAPRTVTAPAGNAIIFAEVTYQYQPLVGSWLLGDRIIRREAAFFVRDERDLTSVQAIGTKAACNQYNATF